VCPRDSGHGPAPRSNSDNTVPGPTAAATCTAASSAPHLSPDSYSDSLSDRAATAATAIAHFLAVLMRRTCLLPGG